MTIIKKYNENTDQWEAIAVGQKGDTGEGLVTGGTTDQVLAKLSNDDFDTQWVTLTNSDVGLGNVPNLDTTDAVNKSHDQNTDTVLNQGGANEVTAEEARDHIDATDNPHGVTKTQVGLGDVPNLDTTSAVAGNFATVNIDGGTIDGTAVNATNLAYTGTLTGGTGVVNLGSGQVFKDANGNVGIGTNSPDFNLTVQNDSGVLLGKFRATSTDPAQASGLVKIESVNRDAILRITGNSTRGASVEFGDENNVAIGNIAYSNVTDSMAFTSNGTERMRIDSSGNVGIGATSPSEKLSVNGDIGFGNGINRTLNFAVVGAGSGFIDITMPTFYIGFMAITNRRFNDPQPVTFRTFSIYGRATTTSFQQIHEFVDGVGAPFTVTSPSSGVIRITNNYFLASDVEVLLQYRNTQVI